MRGKRRCLRALARAGAGAGAGASAVAGTGDDAETLRIKVEGWSVLADAQSALAHSCIVSYYIRSAKFEHLFAAQRDLAQGLQQKMEEAWVALPAPPPAAPFSSQELQAPQSPRAAAAAAFAAYSPGAPGDEVEAAGSRPTRRLPLPFPKEEAKNAIRQLRQRLKDYLLTVQTEILMPGAGSDGGPTAGARRGRTPQARARRPAAVGGVPPAAPTAPAAATAGAVTVGAAIVFGLNHISMLDLTTADD